jgi:hypothetical protein
MLSVFSICLWILVLRDPFDRLGVLMVFRSSPFLAYLLPFPPSFFLFPFFCSLPLVIAQTPNQKESPSRRRSCLRKRSLFGNLLHLLQQVVLWPPLARREEGRPQVQGWRA